MPGVGFEILVYSCYVAQLNIGNLANQNLENLPTLSKSVEN